MNKNKGILSITTSLIIIGVLVVGSAIAFFIITSTEEDIIYEIEEIDDPEEESYIPTYGTYVPIHEFETFGDVTETENGYILTEGTGNSGIFKTIDFPEGASRITFRYKFISPGDGDFLSVHLKKDGEEQDLLVALGVDIDFSRENYISKSAELWGLAGQKGQIIFKLIKRGTQNAVLSIDEIEMFIGDEFGIPIEENTTEEPKEGRVQNIKGDVVYIDSSGHMWTPTFNLPVTGSNEQQYPWGCDGTKTGATSLTDGRSNTDIIVIADCSESGDAAVACDNLEYAGYDDWYLPAQDELSNLYNECNIVNYTKCKDWDNNAQTANYWSSSELSSVGAYSMSYSNAHDKCSTYFVRCARAD